MESSEDDAGNTIKYKTSIIDLQDIPTQFLYCAGMSFCVYLTNLKGDKNGI